MTEEVLDSKSDYYSLVRTCHILMEHLHLGPPPPTLRWWEIQINREIKTSTSPKDGETIVHYFYRGESDLSSVIRPHHCSPSTLCMVVENKGVCKDSHLKCTTSYKCEGINCACNIETSCGDEPKQSKRLRF